METFTGDPVQRAFQSRVGTRTAREIALDKLSELQSKEKQREADRDKSADDGPVYAASERKQTNGQVSARTDDRAW